MSDWFKFGSKSDAPESSPVIDMDKKEQIKTAVRNELAQANAQLLVENMNNKCFKACITRPGPSLSSSEETCLLRCQERYMDAFNIISRSYHTRLSRERMDSITSEIDKTL
ncbi:hypothetical protein BDZ89DRAFT_1068708 [Hymenopellis radicata]|nr:hypothetical protein BDZ89DRAFT_1068708 [Hymenopellis radicata]